jgi:uncharacterized membrane protein YccC
MEMRYVYIVVGAGLSLLWLWPSAKSLAGFGEVLTFSEYLPGLGFLAGGMLLIFAGIKRYSGSWPTLFGIGCASTSLALLIAEIVDFVTRSSDDPIAGLGMAALLALVGMALLHSGHKLYTQSQEIEELKKQLAAAS